MQSDRPVERRSRLTRGEELVAQPVKGCTPLNIERRQCVVTKKLGARAFRRQHNRLEQSHNIVPGNCADFHLADLRTDK